VSEPFAQYADEEFDEMVRLAGEPDQGMSDEERRKALNFHRRVTDDVLYAGAAKVFFRCGFLAACDMFQRGMAKLEGR
jgi:hypothetical protein